MAWPQNEHRHRFALEARDWYDDLEDYDFSRKEWKLVPITNYIPRSTDFVDRLEEIISRIWTFWDHDEVGTSILYKMSLLKKNVNLKRTKRVEDTNLARKSSWIRSGSGAMMSSTTTTSHQLLPKISATRRVSSPGSRLHEAQDCRTQRRCEGQRTGHTTATCRTASSSTQHTQG